MPGIPRTALALVLLLALLGGCAATPDAPPASDAEAKRFESAPRAAIIYLYRADNLSHASTTVWVDDRIVGESLPATYFRVAVRPGHNRISAFAGDQGRLEIDTREGGGFFGAMQVGGDFEDLATNLLGRDSGRATYDVGRPRSLRSRIVNG